ncbi:MAG: hypothetical protein LBD55_09130 [Treponema sp.]|jgi:hypothetical protein|nr:hypothetical protein [Treponema sp.]
MDRTAVEAMEAIVGRSMKIEVDGKIFARDGRESFQRVLYEPEPETVTIHTLTGLVDFVRANVDKLDFKKHLAVVKSPTEVFLLSALSGEGRKRDEIIHIEVDDKMRNYTFGQYQEIEGFIISLTSLFEDSPDREKVIKFVSRVHGGTGFTLSDDGVSQIAEVSKGVSGALTENETAPKIVSLKPFRTFRDIDQPESSFLLRLKLVDEERKIVGACLYEADGGRWRNAAIKGIQEFLEKNLAKEEITVIA